ETAGIANEQDGDDVLDLAESATLIGDTPAGEDVDPPLLREERRAGMRETLAALSMLAEPGAPPQIVRSGETSLEGLVRELLRPALAEWLDKN
ncbi:MAG: DUF2497 domain-containing protein, partial [Novosphingobium sp.]|nr:DUF2497 domain-containing protein [Novosphingobium sp.]